MTKQQRIQIIEKALGIEEGKSNLIETLTDDDTLVITPQDESYDDDLRCQFIMLVGRKPVDIRSPYYSIKSGMLNSNNIQYSSNQFNYHDLIMKAGQLIMRGQERWRMEDADARSRFKELKKDINMTDHTISGTVTAANGSTCIDNLKKAVESKSLELPSIKLDDDSTILPETAIFRTFKPEDIDASIPKNTWGGAKLIYTETLIEKDVKNVWLMLQEEQLKE
jgi:hypothetical protein